MRAGTLKIGWVTALVLLSLSAGAALGQQDRKTDEDEPSDSDTGESTVQESTVGLLPNPLQKYGIKFAATYIGETLGNVSGGLKQGAVYEGRLNVAIDADLQKLAGLRELTFHANMFQIHGDGLSRSNLQNFLVASGIEALPSTRLYEMWFERKWGDTFSVRAGQLAADTEFMNARYTEVFTMPPLSWPAITSVNLPSGGPSPPLAALGARVRANVTHNLTLMGSIFDGDAAGPGLTDPQLRNNHGKNFRINDPPLVIGEASGTERKAIRGSTANSRSAAGGISARSLTNALRWAAFRLQARRVLACRQTSPETSASTRCSSKRSIGSATTTIGASGYSPEFHLAHRIAT